jgi:Holliday junction resolvasome RuvABC endonuclease subunit
MVQSVLGLPDAIASEDAADALAVALCHATHEATRRMLA